MNAFLETILAFLWPWPLVILTFFMLATFASRVLGISSHGLGEIFYAVIMVPVGILVVLTLFWSFLGAALRALAGWAMQPLKSPIGGREIPRL